MIFKRPCYHYHTIFIIFILSILTAVVALPTTTYFKGPVRREPALPSSSADTQTIVTSQTFTSPSGNTTEICTFVRTPAILPNGTAVVILSKNCTSSFTPANATTPLVASTSSASSVTTIATSSIPIATSSSISQPTTSEVGTASTTTISLPTSTTTTSFTPPDDSSDNTQSLSTSTSASLAAATTSPAIQQTTSQGKSTLPIFLGAFGGFAVLALLFVAVKVYNPMQYFNHLRLNPPSCTKRSKGGRNRDTAGGYYGIDKKGLTLRESNQFSAAETSRWSTDSGSQSGWLP